MFDEFCSQNFHTAVSQLIHTKPETFTQNVQEFRMNIHSSSETASS